MELRPALSVLESNTAFSHWKAKNKDAYFSHAFKMFQDEHTEWQLGFYQKKKKMITTFIVKPDAVEMRDAEEVFKKDETEIRPVNLADSALELTEVIQKANEFQKKNYPKDPSMKIIAILQNMQDYGSVWNITYVTQAFNTLNMKIHPMSGNVLDHKISSIFSFRQKQ